MEELNEVTLKLNNLLVAADEEVGQSGSSSTPEFKPPAFPKIEGVPVLVSVRNIHFTIIYLLVVALNVFSFHMNSRRPASRHRLQKYSTRHH